jgi:hypothetical protein
MFENYFGGDSNDYTQIDFRDAPLWGRGRVQPGDGNPELLAAIRRAADNRDLQEFKRFVDVEDYIKNHILFMFLDTENEARGMLYNYLDNTGRHRIRMITIINDLDGAFFNAGLTNMSPGVALAGGGGTTFYKWRSPFSRGGPGGWFNVFSGINATNPAAAGNLEFRTMVKDQVLKQIGPFGGDMRGALGAPLSVDNVNELIQMNFDMLNDTHAYRVDAAWMGFPDSYRLWYNRHSLVLRQTEERVRHSLNRWAHFGMVHTLDAVNIEETATGFVLDNPNRNIHAYFTTNGSDPMGPNGYVSEFATRYSPGTVLPLDAVINVRAFTTNNWGPLTDNISDDD